MRFAEIIAELYRRQTTKNQEEYAAVLKLSPQHFNKILNGAERGSKKLAEMAIDDAKLDWEQVLTLPPDPANAGTAKEAIRIFNEALALEDYAGWAIVAANMLRDKMEKDREEIERTARYRKKKKAEG